MYSVQLGPRAHEDLSLVTDEECRDRIGRALTESLDSTEASHVGDCLVLVLQDLPAGDWVNRDDDPGCDYRIIFGMVDKIEARDCGFSGDDLYLVYRIEEIDYFRSLSHNSVG